MELDAFFRMLTGEESPLGDSLLLSEKLEQASARMLLLSKKWDGLKSAQSAGMTCTIRQDLNLLMRGLKPEIPSDADAIKWEIESTRSFIDCLPSSLPYLSQTGFAENVRELSAMVDDICDGGLAKYRDVLRLLGELRAHSDMLVIGQFGSVAVVDQYRRFSEDCPRPDEVAIREFLSIYGSLCGIYEIDVGVLFCLIKIRNGERRLAYSRVRACEFKGNLDYVRRWGPRELSMPYDAVIRNAVAHSRFVLDVPKEIVRFYKSDGEQYVERSYRAVVDIAREMSALVLACRTLILILVNGNWRRIDRLLV